jgi:hypothetical protein
VYRYLTHIGSAVSDSVIKRGASKEEEEEEEEES